LSSNKYKILNVVGARPNFVKIAPLNAAMKSEKILEPILLHTGQHKGRMMSDSFFRDLEIPVPGVSLNVGYGSPITQMAEILIKGEKYLLSQKPDMIVVVGDVTSTLAFAILGDRMRIPVAHIESGLRSGNSEMLEEMNRILTDHIAQLLFSTTEGGVENLIKEGIDRRRIYMVGNIMIDSLMNSLSKFKTNDRIFKKLHIKPHKYSVLTLHRPECVDYRIKLKGIIDALIEIQKDIQIIWPLHPRTKSKLKEFNLYENLSSYSNLIITKPLRYLEFQKLVSEATFVMTDSGGIQEFAFYHPK